MSEVQIYHNPRCSKSRETLALLQARGISPQVVLYLQTPPDPATLHSLLSRLGFSSARQLMRTKEVLYQQLGLADETLSEAQLCQAMAAHPKLIERPLVLANGKARLGRPPENVLDII
ncbi:arsenate reductase (glutaredoxin) [Erwinia psidii]|uniref:Arsenate reductase n=1 Tax=Erwinia psidii TaxID=69224 RepID=A0A3N6SJX5_9GAMM|nr:arsenate reductase (glutaredoxin) [Erwinia psidii]MCX8956748.1 arsenate reductase (glutaredoxin) [Erwinia psidii]MCX8960442.1 arsenate reductase (glutaredoxin) [Erwinia psidii]MCX8964376.1 arsenate reductase (glutaredoxin) [Erwinia psidii]RQM40243.1 arsenate reductase (glutaredoxin) [Erwinia psidii]